MSNTEEIKKEIAILQIKYDRSTGRNAYRLGAKLRKLKGLIKA